MNHEAELAVTRDPSGAHAESARIDSDVSPSEPLERNPQVIPVTWIPVVIPALAAWMVIVTFFAMAMVL